MILKYFYFLVLFTIEPLTWEYGNLRVCDFVKMRGQDTRLKFKNLKFYHFLVYFTFEPKKFLQICENERMSLCEYKTVITYKHPFDVQFYKF